MKKLLVLLVSALPFTAVHAEFTPAPGIMGGSVKALAFDGSDIYAVTANSFAYAAAGGAFVSREIFKDESPVALFYDSGAVVATTRHVYRYGCRRDTLFAVDDEETIFDAARYRGDLYVATNRGLFSKGRFFKRHLPCCSQETVYDIEPSPVGLYILSESGLYRQSEKKLEKIYSFLNRLDGTLPVKVHADSFDPQKIWLLNGREVLVSTDSGKSWEKFSCGDVAIQAVRDICQNKSSSATVYFAAKGVLKVDCLAKSVTALNDGLPTVGVNRIYIDSNGRLYAATDKGLFVENPHVALSAALPVTQASFAEPPINEVHNAALRYNQVHPEKIKAWRRGLKARSLMPKLNLDYNKTMNYDSKTYRYMTGPRDWSVGVSWDLGDIFWNTYEDDIDTRARLDTQMRFDLIDEIDRMYFERVRLEREMKKAATSSEKQSKELRLEELTATLDGYTGGWFSKRVIELTESRK